MSTMQPMPSRSAFSPDRRLARQGSFFTEARHQGAGTLEDGEADASSSEPAPGWLVATVSAAEAVGFKPGRPVRLALAFVTYLGFIVWWLYCIYRGLRAAAHERLPVDTVGCALRAELPFLISMLMSVIDFSGMLHLMRTDAPYFWSAFGGKGLGSASCTSVARRSVEKQPAVVIISVTVFTLLLAFWLAPGGGWEWTLASAVGFVGLQSVHMLLNAVSMEFMVVYRQDAQKKFQDDLMAGQYDYQAAVRAFKEVNEKRRQVGTVLGQTFHITLFLFLVQQVVLVYDWFLKPWSAWPLIFFYVIHGLGIMGLFSEHIAMNDFPARLSKRVASSIDGELLWSPAERTHFLAYLANTRSSYEIAGFEINRGFYLALAAWLVGWFMYIAELKQFHEFEGFPFDQACDGHHEEGEMLLH